MSELRARRVAGDEAAKVVPLDSSEQDRIIREFQLDKMKQDRLWKHMLSVLYGVGAFLLSCNVVCSVVMGCGPPASDSPLDGGPRCLYFQLPSSLWVATGQSALGANALMILGLATVIAWAAYAFALDFTGSKMQFNSARATKTAAARTQAAAARATGESKEQVEAMITASSSSLLPIGQPERSRLQLFYRLSHVLILVWSASCIALAALHRDPEGLGILVWMLLSGPLALAALTKLAAQWSNELEQQIQELQGSKYSYHEL